MTTAEVLLAAKKLIDKPEKWTKGIMFARDRMCAVGAIAKATMRLPHSNEYFTTAHRCLTASKTEEDWVKTVWAGKEKG